MLFNCPGPNNKVVIYGPPPDPSAAGTMCACGMANLAFLRRAATRAGAEFVRVRVVLASAPAQSPEPASAGDVDITPENDGSWTANGMWVPVPDDQAWSLKAYAWLLVPASGGVTNTDSGNVAFEGGGVPGDTDCCTDCTGGSSPVALPGPLVAELAARITLDVTVPDGKHAGIYQATTVAHMKWQVKVGGVHYTVSTCAARKTLMIHGASSPASHKTIAYKPFSATFPGSVFGASIDIVVT
jgi:hypothetical protein